MDRILQVLNWIKETDALRFAKGILVIWMILGVFCLFFGALALIPAGRRKRIRSYPTSPF